MASVAGREFLSPVIAHLVGPRRAAGGRGPAAPRSRAPADRRERRGDAARRHAGDAVPLRPRALPVGAARGPRGLAPARAAPRGRGAPACTTGAPRRRGSPPRSPATARRGATTRGPSPSGGTPATTPPGSSPTRRRRSTTTGPSGRSRSCPPRAAPRPRSPSTSGGGAVRLAQARFDDATADFESMLGAARGDGSGRGRARGAGRPVRRALLRPAGRGDGRPGAGAARGRQAGGRETATRPRPTRGSARCSSVEGRLDEAVPLLDGAIASARRRRPAGRAQDRPQLPRVRPLLADRVRGRRDHRRRDPVDRHRARRRLLRPRRAHVPGPRAREPGPHLGSDRRLRGRHRGRPAQRRPVLAAAPREPPRVGASRAGRSRSRPRVRHRGRPAGSGAARAGPGGRRCS